MNTIRRMPHQRVRTSGRNSISLFGAGSFFSIPLPSFRNRSNSEPQYTHEPFTPRERKLLLLALIALVIAAIACASHFTRIPQSLPNKLSSVKKEESLQREQIAPKAKGKASAKTSASVELSNALKELDELVARETLRYFRARQKTQFKASPKATPRPSENIY